MAMALGERELDEALALGYAEGGYEAALRRALDVAEARLRSGNVRNVAPLGMAALYKRIGETERALDWLERAYEARNPNLPAISGRRHWDELRYHPRFQALLRKMNLPIS